MSGRLIITKGLPASGKSTWAREEAARALKALIVTKDDIRAELFQKNWNYDKEKEVLRVRDFRISEGLNKGWLVISADTNLALKHEMRLRELAKKYKSTFEIKDFTDVPILTCIERDMKRDETEQVGEKVIRDMAEQFYTASGLVPGRLTPQLFVDLDGVLADFDGFVEKTFGIVNNKENERPDFWDIMRGYKGRLYADLAPLSYAKKLWKALKPYKPVILTGVPFSLPTAAQDKRDWVRQYIDPDVQVVTCRSRCKAKYGVRGDLLLDDWRKHEHLWTEMGGVFLHHTDPDQSIKMVQERLSH